MKYLIVPTLILFLSACTGSRNDSVPVTAGWTFWRCEGDITLEWRYGNTRDDVQVRLDSAGKVYSLRREPSAIGEFFTDGTLAFHMRDNEGLAYWLANDDLIGNDCKP